MGTLEPRRTTDRAPFALDGNRLTVATESEKDFLNGFEEFFWVLMHSERDRLILDLSHTQGLDLTAYQMIALNLFEIGNKNKRLTLRIPKHLEKFFRQAGLHRAAEIEVVWHLGNPARAGQASSAVTAASESQESRQAATDATAVGDENLADRVRELANKPATPGASASDTAGSESLENVPMHLLRRIGKGALIDPRTQIRADLPARSNGEVFLGRTPDNQLQVASPLVSRRHCRINREGDRYYITDLASGNGTYVNGHRLAADTPRPLFHGDTIILAVTRQFPHGTKTFTFEQDEF